MNYHKLLAKQIGKHLPASYREDPEIRKFLEVISDSYGAFDKDNEVAARAFVIAEEEYLEVNKKLNHEMSVREQSVEKLKEAIEKITGEVKMGGSNDLLMITRYLNQQINKRKNAELVFNSLIANLPSGILLEDENGSVVYVNQQFCELFRCPSTADTMQDMDRKTSRELRKSQFMHPEEFKNSIEKRVEEKKLFTGEILGLADGRIFERDYIPIWMDGKYKGSLWSYSDITEKKKTEEEYKRISLVASANESGVLFTSFDGRITWANEGFCKLTGFAMEEVIGKTPIELCRGPLTDKSALDKVLNAFYNGLPFSIEIVYYRKDGSWFCGRSTTQPVKDERGNVIQFFGIIDDVTEERDSENRFRMALDKIGDNVWEHNFLTGETKFSDTENHLLGYSKSEFNSNSDLWWNNIHPDDRHLLEENDRKYKLGLLDHHGLEYRMIHKSGEIRWVLDKGVVIEWTADKQPFRIIGTHTDISFIKKTEMALRENEERFRSLEENIPGILYKYEFDNNGQERFTYISPEPEKKIGITAEELQNFYDIIHPDDKERELEVSRIARGKNRPYHFVGRFQAPGKPAVWLSLSSSYSHMDEKGSIVYTGIILNITREKETELISQLKEKKYRNIIANMNLGLLEVDTQEIIQFVNSSFCDMSGYKMEELVGKSAAKLFIRSEDNQLLEMKNENRRKGISDAYEICIKSRKGENRWWLISGAPRYNDRGELIGSIGIHLDITQQKKLEYELVEARVQAESSAKAKQIFLANMSHEIRTPMNAIIGMANQLKKTTLDKDQQFYLKIINSAADNLLIIINDILDLSKLEAGKLNIEQIGFKPRELLNQSLLVMMHKAEEKGLSLTNSHFDEGVFPILIGDPYRLNQVLLNLFSNAIKFTEKGVVDITCRLAGGGEQEQIVEFIVKDSGIGMEESFLKNLFQKFRQEDESVTRRFGGTGLGLSICKELIEFMGGSIRVESKKNVGTTVFFSLPLGKGKESDLKVEVSGSVDARALMGKKILITDDNEMNRLLANTILKQYGAILDEAQNGVEAIEKIRKNSYDVVLMDVQMPVMDGIQATRIIRETISSKLPVIALTALALKGDESKFLEAGMSGYLSKPFDENQILHVITNCLGQPQGPVQISGAALQNGSLYDLAKLNEIARGDTAFVEKMARIFISQAPQSVLEITEAYNLKDLEKMGKVAHRFKTSLMNMGVGSLKEDINRIEDMGQTNQDGESLGSMITHVGQIVRQVVEELSVQFKE